MKLPKEWDVFIPPSMVDIIETSDNPEITMTRPVWNQEWLNGLESFIRSIIRDEYEKSIKPQCRAGDDE